MRTEQDNNITLYSYNELLIMKDRWHSNQWVPFSLLSIEQELKLRS